jgi:hypothetical protein
MPLAGGRETCRARGRVTIAARSSQSFSAENVRIERSRRGDVGIVEPRSRGNRDGRAEVGPKAYAHEGRLAVKELARRQLVDHITIGLHEGLAGAAAGMSCHGGARRIGVLIGDRGDRRQDRRKTSSRPDHGGEILGRQLSLIILVAVVDLLDPAVAGDKGVHPSHQAVVGEQLAFGLPGHMVDIDHRAVGGHQLDQRTSGLRQAERVAAAAIVELEAGAAPGLNLWAHGADGAVDVHHPIEQRALVDAGGIVLAVQERDG